ncbi:hypothetical protein IJG44_08940 [bacterium]|nr:hypothetical protein [bacterium]MBQ4439318.1 hypothetical protein [bacterium]
MRRFFSLFLFLFFLFPIFAESAETTLLTLKYQATAIGEISLAYRLETLTMSLAAAKAVDKEYITAILDEVDATVENGKSIITTKNASPDQLTKEIIAAFDQLLKCSGEIKKYSSAQGKTGREEVEKCLEISRDNIDKLTDMYQKIQNKNKVNGVNK